jgi:hypothetical protein
MTDPGHATPDGEFTCTCGAVYRVEQRHTTVPDTDTVDCVCCGRRIASWRNQTTWPSYELIRRPPGQ